jgi:hypothetical protein
MACSRRTRRVLRRPEVVPGDMLRALRSDADSVNQYLKTVAVCTATYTPVAKNSQRNCGDDRKG